MDAPADSDEHLGVGDAGARGGVEKAPEDLFGCGGLESGKPTGKAAVQGVGYQGQHQVQVDLLADASAR